MEWLVSVGIFFGIICMIEGTVFLFRSKRKDSESIAKKRLSTLGGKASQGSSVSLRKQRIFSTIPHLNFLLSRLPSMQRLDRLVIAANSRIPLGVFLLISFVSALLSYLMLVVIVRGPTGRSLIALCVAALPFVYLYIKKNKRMAKFERQLPEALDLMARSLKAGHAFSGGLNMVALNSGNRLAPNSSKSYRR